MMDFTVVEIQELKVARQMIKIVKGKPTRAASTSLAGGNSTNSMSKDNDEGSVKTGLKRGLFGAMFGNKNKAGSNANVSGGGTPNNGNGSAAGLPPPNLKPVARR